MPSNARISLYGGLGSGVQTSVSNHFKLDLSERDVVTTRGYPAVSEVMLVIVAWTQPSLYHYLTVRFAGIPGVEVLLDRRHGQRRREEASPPTERRSGNERRKVRGEAHPFGFTLVRVDSPTDTP